MEVFICDAQGHGGIVCEGKKCCAHIISRQFKTIAASKKNHLYICKRHEQYFNTIGKDEWPLFIKTNFPEKYTFILSKYELILHEYEKFRELSFPFKAEEIPAKAQKPVVEKTVKKKAGKLCTCPCHTRWKDEQAYCWDCHNNHSVIVKILREIGMT